MRLPSPTSLAFACLALQACAATDGPPTLVAGREVASSSRAPRVTRIQDLGAPRRLLTGETVSLAGADGVGAIGEVLLISGDGFGRLPRVRVGGQLAEELGRTAGGGILVRVPWGARVGEQRIEVINAQGRSGLSFPIRRYALATVPSRDTVFVLEVDQGGVRVLGKSLRLANARQVRYSSDGQMAYVGGRDEEGHLTVSTIDMTAPGGPRLLDSKRIPGETLVALAAADSAPVAAALSDTSVVFFDTRDPRAAASYPAHPLPEELKEGLVAVEMDREGKLLAALLAPGNQVRLYDISQPDTLRSLATAQVLPKAPASLVRDMRFSSDSSTLWVISGDTLESVASGHAPLRLTVIRIQVTQRARTKSFGVLSLWRTLDVPHKAAPVQLVVAKGQPTADGATVRIPPKNAGVFITAHDASLLKLASLRFDRAKGLRRAVDVLRKSTALGTVVRTDLDGKGGPLFDSPSLLGSVDLTSDTQLLLVAGAKVEVRQKPAAVRLVYGVSSSRVFGKPEPRFIPLAEVDPDSLARPFLLGEVRIQP